VTSFTWSYIEGRLNAHAMLVAAEGPTGKQRKLSWRLPYYPVHDGDMLDDWSAM
jgi:hypothetical protein